MTLRVSVLLLTCLLTVTSWAVEPIRSVKEVRELPLEWVKEKRPVVIEAVATFVDAQWGMLFIHDGLNGCYVMNDQLVIDSKWLKAGRKVRVTGVTGEGNFLPVVLATKLEDLGPSAMPTPTRLTSMDEVFTPSMDSQWIEVEAVVKRLRDENSGLTLYLDAGGQRVNGLLPRHLKIESMPIHFIEQRVRILAVAATQFNDERQMSGRNLFVPGLEFVSLINAPKELPPAPARRVDELLRATSEYNERAKVQGIVTHAVPEQTLYIRGEGGSMKIDTALAPDYKPGAVVEAEGYATFTPFRPGINATVLRLVAHGLPPKPVPFLVAAERRSAEQYELITLEAEFLEKLGSRPREIILLCRDGNVAFEAKLSMSQGTVLDLEPGMRLRLTGICELEVGVGNPLGLTKLVSGFTLRLRSAQDVLILKRPSYWNETRLTLLLSAVGGAGLFIAFWAYLLRRRLAAQAVIISNQTAEKATLEERQRIARELHDTLEQELSGVSMLLDTTSQRLQTGTGEVMESLDLARHLLRHSREESRTTIRDLRSVTIEQLGLAGAMETLLRPLAESAGMSFDCQIQGRRRSLPGTVESALLRIAHEAVANAARHSQGSQVQVLMSYLDDAVRLEITDDGVGFRAEEVGGESTGHFGLSGMKERALKLGATLRIGPAETPGTRVTVTMQTTSSL
jgi:signal transduction histidine kinase